MQIKIFHKAAYLHEVAEVKLLEVQGNRICPLIVLGCFTMLMNLLKQINFLLLKYLLKDVLSVSQGQEYEKAEGLKKDEEKLRWLKILEFDGFHLETISTGL